MAAAYLGLFVLEERYDRSYGYDTDARLALASGVVLGLWMLTWSSYVWLNSPFRGRIRWSDQLVVITGGASGIGASTALLLASRGARVVTLDVAKAQPEAIASRLGIDLDAARPNITAYICDVSSSDAVGKVTASIRALHGDPTVLVHCAGVVNATGIDALPPAAATTLVNVHLTSHLWLLSAFVPAMLRNGSGHIVTTASILGQVGVAQMVDYCAAKHGLVGVHRSLRQELPRSIKTSLLVLGHVNTNLFRGVKFGFLARFLAPSLEPDAVARRIVRAVETRTSGTIAMPWYANWVEAIALLPSWAVDLLSWISGSNTSMAVMNKNRS